MIRMTLAGPALFATLFACSSAMAECDLKIADLTARMEQRRSDTIQWEKELDEIGAGTNAAFVTVMEHVSSGDNCPDSIINDINAKIRKLVQVNLGNSVPRDGGISAEIANTFECIGNTSMLLEAAKAKAVADNNSMQLLRYNSVTDTLATLDRSYTKVLVDAKAAEMRGQRIAEMLAMLDNLCSESDF